MNTATETKTPQQANIDFVMSHKENAKLEEYKNIKIVTYDSNIRGEIKPCAQIWKGKQKNPFSHYYYPTEERRVEAIQRSKDSTDKQLKWKEEAKAERKSFKPEVEVGDIYVASWGYEQTNIDYYQVIEKVGKCTVKIREIAGTRVEDSMYSHGMACEMMPEKDSFLERGEVMQKRVGKYGITIDSVRSASKWTGGSNYCSWYY